MQRRTGGGLEDWPLVVVGHEEPNQVELGCLRLLELSGDVVWVVQGIFQQAPAVPACVGEAGAREATRTGREGSQLVGSAGAQHA